MSKHRDYPGNISKLKPGMLVDYFVQQHNAKRRGLHYDLRLGNEKTDLFSWATEVHPLKMHEGDKIHAARTNLHQHSYGSWEGMIPKGYGHGEVKLDSKGKALITNTTDKTVSFSTGDGKYPNRYTLITPDPESKGCLLLRQKTPEETGVSKIHYKTTDDPKAIISKLDSSYVAQPKLDGALQFLTLSNGKLEMLSHQLSSVHGKPIVHTERFFGYRPHVKIPKDLNNTVVLAEVYGTKEGKPIPPQETSALLNSALGKSVIDQKKNNIEFKAMLFDVAKHKDKTIKFDIPYDERRAILDRVLKIVGDKQFHLPEEVRGKNILKLWNEVKGAKHDLTSEGIIVYPEKGVPTKLKHTPEHDVVIRSFFGGEGKYKDKGAGGFNFSYTPKGPIAGKVGTGLNDKLRALMLSNPEQFIGRIARVKALSKLPSGALREPSLINIHEG